MKRMTTIGQTDPAGGGAMDNLADGSYFGYYPAATGGDARPFVHWYNGTLGHNTGVDAVQWDSSNNGAGQNYPCLRSNASNATGEVIVSTVSGVSYATEEYDGIYAFGAGGAGGACGAAAADDAAWWRALAPSARVDVVRGMVAAFQSGYGIAVLRFEKKALSRIAADRSARRITSAEAAARRGPVERTVSDQALYPHFTRQPAYYVQRIDEYYRTQLDGSSTGTVPAPVSKVLLCLSDVPLVACDDVRFQ